MVADNIKKLITELEQNYSSYYQDGIGKRWLRQSDILPLIERLPNQFSVKEVGSSIEGRLINQLTWGTGPVRIAMWSQMHGDESTATRALFDLFRYLASTEPEVRNLYTKITLSVIPMLNPDGSEVYQRRNAVGVDINRDAVALACPESIILKELIDSSGADYGFNLHDQSRYYSIGNSHNPATFTFLTPAFDEEKTINSNRAKMMNLILDLKTMLEQFVPGQVGRYDDTYNARAFGDNIQKWGTATILFEAGEMPGDPEREYVRKLFFMALVQSIYAITDGLQEGGYEPYFKIPENNKNMCDKLVRGIRVGSVEVDLALNEVDDQYVLVDVGDLSNYSSYSVVEQEGVEYTGLSEQVRPDKPFDSTLLKSADGSPVI